MPNGTQDSSTGATTPEPRDWHFLRFDECPNGGMAWINAGALRPGRGDALVIAADQRVYRDRDSAADLGDPTTTSEPGRTPVPLSHAVRAEMRSWLLQKVSASSAVVYDMTAHDRPGVETATQPRVLQTRFHGWKGSPASVVATQRLRSLATLPGRGSAAKSTASVTMRELPPVAPGGDADARPTITDADAAVELTFMKAQRADIRGQSLPRVRDPLAPLIIRRKPIIAMCGASEPTAEQQEAARQVAYRLVRGGAMIACGGHGGVMTGAAQGAFEAGGDALGLLPGKDADEANPFITIPISTGFGELRNGAIINSCDAAVFIGGGYGTLNEFALALRSGKATVALDSWTARRPGQKGADPNVLRAGSPAHAVRLIIAAANEKHAWAPLFSDGAPPASRRDLPHNVARREKLRALQTKPAETAKARPGVATL